MRRYQIAHGSEISCLLPYTNLGQVTTVHSGYRWVLTYNLVSTRPGMVNSAAVSEDKDTETLRAFFRDWRKNDPVDQMVSS